MLTILLANLLAGLANANGCRSIAFGGDALRGPYQAGVLQGLYEELPAEQIEFQIATGVGVGALNAVMLGRFGMGDEKLATQYITTFWRHFTPDYLYTSWFGGELAGEWYHNGYYDPSPMNHTIYKKLFVNSDFGREVTIGTLNLKSGRFTVFNSTMPLENIALGIQASVTLPGIFPPVQYGDKQLITGTPVYPADLRCARNYCRSLGYEDKDITIYVVKSSSTVVDASKYNTSQAFTRYNELLSLDSINDEVDLFDADFPDVNVHVISPSEIMQDNSSKKPFSFTEADVNSWIELGKKDAKKYIKNLK